MTNLSLRSFVLKSAEGASAADWDAVFASNVKGMGLTTKYAVRAMRASPGAPQGDGSTTRPGACVGDGLCFFFQGGGPGLHDCLLGCILPYVIMPRVSSLSPSHTHTRRNTHTHNTAGGAIVNLGSISSFIGQGGLCTYSTTKAAVLALTRYGILPERDQANELMSSYSCIHSCFPPLRVLPPQTQTHTNKPNLRCTAIDCGPYGIRVNAICPGPILTDATRRHADSCGKSVAEMVKEMNDHMVQHRMGDPSEARL